MFGIRDRCCLHNIVNARNVTDSYAGMISGLKERRETVPTLYFVGVGTDV